MISQLVFLFLALGVSACSSTICAVDDAGCQLDNGQEQQFEELALLQRGLAGVLEHRHLQPVAAPAGNPTMDDVEVAMTKLDSQGAPMLLYKNPAVFPSSGYDQHAAPYSTHFQGIQRLRPGAEGAATYFVLTGASNQAAHIFIGKVSSRAAGPGQVVGSPELKSKVRDQVASVAEVDKELTHAGGPAIWGDYLVVGSESGCSFSERIANRCKKTSAVWFYDLSDPEKPKKLPYNIVRPEGTAGAVGIVQQKDGMFLLMVGRDDSAIIDFYVSKGSDLATDPEFGSIVATWEKKELLVNPGMSSKFESYQNLNMVMQTDGTIFFIGTSRYPLLVGPDFFDLYKLKLTDSRAEITKVASRQTRCVDCDFYAGAGIYIDSATSMLAYGVSWNPDYDGKITINEFGEASSHPYPSPCNDDTGGSCWDDIGSFCSASRGPTTCSGKKCKCKVGYCAVQGHCVPLR